MPSITDNVSFDTIAREWRCKWDEADNKKSLSDAQAALDEVLAELKALPGVKSVQRVVCGGCHDFKVTFMMRPSPLTFTLPPPLLSMSYSCKDHACTCYSASPTAWASNKGAVCLPV